MIEHAQQQVTNALAEWTDLPADAARRLKPPVSNIGRTTPRFGYAQHTLSIDDIARVDDVYPGSRTDYSQRQSGYSATSIPALGVI
ncbi:hypothetical protein [Actinacidiphila glaucinigra]|uniref:hypothetical protein n=1 Tax=Actinacidiphila glaucinigra TaxID=235986 RepID=UPI0036E81A1B